LCYFLYKLSQAYNTFYAKNRILGSKKEKERLQITKVVQLILKNGLSFLGIPSPERV